MKEILVYGMVAVSSLIFLGYSVHMLVGGIVSKRTESIAIVAVVVVAAAAIGVMAWDVIRRRRRSRL